MPGAPDRPSGRTARRLGLLFWLPAAWIVLVIGSTCLAPVLRIPSPTQVGVTGPGAGPSLQHLLGSDDLGRDVLSRVIYGARVSLTVGLAGAGLGLVLAGTLGLIAGFAGGVTDRLISLLADTLLAFPGLVFSLAIVAFVGPNLPVIVLSLGVGAVGPGVRVFRGVALRWAGQDFVTASRLLGARTGRLLWRHILPNLAPTAISYGLIAVSVVMTLEAALSFFGISVRPPTPSWGNMINEGAGYLQEYPWLVLWPSLALFVTVLAFNLLADQLDRFFSVREGRL